MKILRIFLLDDLVGLARLFPALLCLGLLGMLAAEFIRSAAPADEKAVFVSVPLAVSYVLFRAASVAGRNPRLRSANPVNWDDRVEVSLAISVFFLLVLLVLAALSMLVYKLLLLTWAVDIAFRSIMILVAMLIAVVVAAPLAQAFQHASRSAATVTHLVSLVLRLTIGTDR